MMMDVRIVAQGRDYAGVPAEQIRRAVAQGRISGEDLVRLAGTSAWTPIAQVPDLAAHLPAAPSVAPAPRPAPAQPAVARPAAAPKPAPTPTAPALVSAPAAPRPSAQPAARTVGQAITQAAMREVDAVDEATLDGAEFGIEEPARPRRRRPRRRLEESVLDLTPMIDVTFQLLIFFMFTNQMANPNPISVPQAAYGRGVMPDGKQALLVDDQGRYYFGESTKEENIAPSLDALVREVSDVASSRGEPLEVIISAHKGSKYVHLRELVERLEQVENIGAVHVGVEEKQ